MKVQVIGQITPGELGRSFMDAFISLGADVSGIDYLEEYNATPLAWNRIASRAFRGVFAQAMHGRILRKMKGFKPDLVFVVKGHLLRPETLSAIRASGAKLFNYYPDSPFVRVRSNFTPWLPYALPLYDVQFTFAKHMTPDFIKSGCKKVVYLPFASDLKLHHPVSESEDRAGSDLSQFSCDISFIGNIDEERARWLAPIADFDLKLWGASYPKSVLRDPRLKSKVQGRPLYGRDFAKAAHASRICLNLMRTQNLGSHNMRTFEAPACGAFVLSQRTPEVTSLFAEDEEAVYFSSFDELRGKVEYYLNHPAERKHIASAGLRRAQQETYAKRAALVLEVFNSTKGE